MIIFICLAVFALFASYFAECFFTGSEPSHVVVSLFLILMCCYFIAGYHVAEDENRKRIKERCIWVGWGEYIFIMLAWPFFVDDEGSYRDE